MKFCIVFSPAPTPQICFAPQGMAGMWVSWVATIFPYTSLGMNSAICLLWFNVLTGFCGFCSVLFCFEFVRVKKRTRIFFGCTYQLIFGCFLTPRPAGSRNSSASASKKAVTQTREPELGLQSLPGISKKPERPCCWVITATAATSLFWGWGCC